MKEEVGEYLSVERFDTSFQFTTKKGSERELERERKKELLCPQCVVCLRGVFAILFVLLYHEQQFTEKRGWKRGRVSRDDVDDDDDNRTTRKGREEEATKTSSFISRNKPRTKSVNIRLRRDYFRNHDVILRRG